MPRRIPVYATLLLVAFLVGRWYVETQLITETLQVMEAGLVETTAEEPGDLPHWLAPAPSPALSMATHSSWTAGNGSA